MESRQFAIPISRNVAEYAAILIWWLLMLWLLAMGQIGTSALTVIVILG